MFDSDVSLPFSDVSAAVELVAGDDGMVNSMLILRGLEEGCLTSIRVLQTSLSYNYTCRVY